MYLRNNLKFDISTQHTINDVPRCDVTQEFFCTGIWPIWRKENDHDR